MAKFCNKFLLYVILELIARFAGSLTSPIVVYHFYGNIFLMLIMLQQLKGIVWNVVLQKLYFGIGSNLFIYILGQRILSLLEQRSVSFL